MGQDLKILPSTSPDSCISIEEIKFEREYPLFDEIINIDFIYGVDSSIVGVTTMNGVIHKDAFEGNPIRSVTAGTLKDLQSVRNSKALDQVRQLPDSIICYLYWF